jgi:ArsR family transcriptional regulator
MKDAQLTREITRLHADFCSALADTRRLLLIYALNEGPKNVTELTEVIEASQPAVSRHLKMLRERGLVRAKREGVNVTYSLADDRLIEALDLLRAVMRDRLTEQAELVESVDEA